jgi:hypothetical protein
LLYLTIEKVHDEFLLSQLLLPKLDGILDMLSPSKKKNRIILTQKDCGRALISMHECSTWLTQFSLISVCRSLAPFQTFSLAAGTQLGRKKKWTTTLGTHAHLGERTIFHRLTNRRY